jgi:hypothetical protein
MNLGGGGLRQSHEFNPQYQKNKTKQNKPKMGKSIKQRLSSLKLKIIN